VRGELIGFLSKLCHIGRQSLSPFSRGETLDLPILIRLLRASDTYSTGGFRLDPSKL